MEILIRKANKKDYKGICKLVREIHSLHVENRSDSFIDCDTPLEFSRFHKIIKDDYSNIFVAINKENKEVVGYTIVKLINLTSFIAINSKYFVYIDDFCIKSSYQRRGIGKRLFSYVVNYSKSLGATALELCVWDFNKKAIEFYKSLGMITKNIRMELNLK